jgi:hypothetical protein
MKHTSRIIVQLDVPVASKSVATTVKRAERLTKLAAKRGAKLQIIIPGLMAARSILRSLNVKSGPMDKVTGTPKYIVIRGKLRDDVPAPKPVVKAKAGKAVKPEKAADKAAPKPRKARRQAAPEVTAMTTPPAPAAPATTQAPAPAAPQPPAPQPQLSSALATEMADSAAPSSPSAAAPHARKG